jgi:serine acetyltransferase
VLCETRNDRQSRLDRRGHQYQSGVTIGDNSIVGAGSVVTKDVAANVIAAGVPCRVIRSITEADRVGFPRKSQIE